MPTPVEARGILSYNSPLGCLERSLEVVEHRQELADERGRKDPFVTLESQTPVGDFDIFAFSVSFEWDYTNKMVHLSMPGYIAKVLQRFGHERPRRIQNSPHSHVAPTYGAKAQFVEVENPGALFYF